MLKVNRLQHAIACLGLSATLAIGAASAEAPVVQGATLQLDIPAQSLKDALQALALASRHELLYSSKLVRGMSSVPLKGEFTTEQAVARLLEGTDLAYEITDGKLVVIHRRGEKGKGVAPTSGEVTQATEARIASVQGMQASGMKLVEKEVQPPQSGGQEDAATVEKGTPEILVRGRKSLNADIQRTEDDPQPYVVFDAQDIERSQATTVEDFLMTRLPMNASATLSSQGTDDTRYMGFSQINLRGLGLDETLILVNGRRIPGISLSGNSASQPDINGIPLSSIERIEVLPSTAGGIYGGSATGGVINIILKSDYSGLQVRATYGNTFDTDLGTRRIEGNAGFGLEGGKTQINISASYSDANELRQGDRDFQKRSREKLLRTNSATVYGTTTPPLGATPNIRSRSATLTLDSQYGGAVLPFNFTYIPRGYSGPGSDDGDALIENAGNFNLDIADDRMGSGRTIFTVPEVRSVAKTADE